MKTLRISVLIKLSVLIIPFIVYFLTLPPTITSFGDSSELITSAYTFSTAHPPGYPLYIIVGKLFTLLPFGTIAWRLHLSSAIFGALTVLFVYLTLKLQTKNDLVSLFAVLILAFSHSFWLYNITAEVFSLNNLMAILVIYTILVWRRKTLDNQPHSLFYLYLSFFLLALGLANHYSVILVAPALLYLVLITKKRLLFTKLIKLTIVFSLGLLPYLQIIYSANQAHVPAYGNLPSWTRFLSYVLRLDYGGPISAGAIISPPQTAPDTFFYFKLLANQFTPFAFLIILLGFWLVYKKAKWEKLFPFILYLFAGILVFLRYLTQIDPTDLHVVGVAERFSLLSFVPFALCLGVSLAEILNWYRLRGSGITADSSLAGDTSEVSTDFTSEVEEIESLGLRKHLGGIYRFHLRGVSSKLSLGNPLPRRYFYLGIATLIIAFQLARTYPNVGKNNYLIAKNYALNILNQVEDNAIILSADDLTISSLDYFTQVEQIKPKIIIISSAFLSNTDYQIEIKKYWPDLYNTSSQYHYNILRDIIETNQGKRPVYFVMLDDPYPLGFNQNPYRFLPRGLVLTAITDLNMNKVQQEVENIDWWQKYNLSGLDQKYQDAFAKNNVQTYAFRHRINAQVFMEHLHIFSQAKKEVEAALATAPDDSAALEIKKKLETEYKDFADDFRPKQDVDYGKEAKEHLAKAQAFVQTPSVMKDFNLFRAVYEAQLAIAKDQQNWQAHELLAQLYEAFGYFKDAQKEYNIATSLKPKNEK